METILYSKSERLRKDRRRLDGMMERVVHYPVMYKEVIDNLNLQKGYVIVDATVGTGGHSLHILSKIGAEGHLFGIDRDAESLKVAAEKLKPFEGSFSLIQGNFRNIDTILNNAGLQQVDGIVFDLGISSYQLEAPERGFSFLHEAALDMRMDRDCYFSAYDLVNNLSVKELSDIIRRFGEERWHHRIARAIERERKNNPIVTTTQLASVVLRAIPRMQKDRHIHPATRTFQALRIAVNRELEALEEALSKVVDFLKPGARLVVISFHSLEDRIAKRTFKRFASEKRCRIITPKPLRPRPEEVVENRRSRPAKLRVCEVI